MIKELLKKILPKQVVSYIQEYKFKRRVLKAFKYDAKIYIDSSDRSKSYSENTLIGKIIRKYHVVEKGLTMPERRLGFGTKIIISLCNQCVEYIKNYSSNNCQLKHAIGVLMEYKKLHEVNNFQLDDEVITKLEEIEKYQLNDATEQISITNKEYFSKKSSDFKSFSNSRKSIRNYSNTPVSIAKIHNSLELATNTPSACNRQAWRTYMFSDKEVMKNILKVQGGNRGFGHLADKLIVITAEVGLFYNAAERNQAFIDGGIYAMNLLYSLHYNEIGACILNCSFTPEKDQQLRSLVGIKPSEVFIAMIVCGNLPEKFLFPISKRYSIDITHSDR